MNDVVPFDLERLLWGSAPFLFYAEIVVRVVTIWLWTILLLRWVGGRSVSQMSVVEFLLVIALGSAVGDSMFQPEVPLLHAMLVILLVVLADKAVDYALQHWPKAKRFVDGTPTEIVRDGHLCAAGLRAERIGATEVMELLRLKGIRNLGEVKHGFMEPSGDLSLFHHDRPLPGLCIMPPLELQPPPPAVAGADHCCVTCGLVRRADVTVCPECGDTQTTVPQLERSGPEQDVAQSG